MNLFIYISLVVTCHVIASDPVFEFDGYGTAHSDLSQFVLGGDTESNVEGANTEIVMTESATWQTGVVWYEEPVNILDGLQCVIDFKITEKSLHCDVENIPDISANRQYDLCTESGADGFAFVIQNVGAEEDVHGSGGSGIGYSGIDGDAVSIEYDTFYDMSLDDFFDNHLSVHAGLRGDPKHRISSHHNFSCAHTDLLIDADDGDTHRMYVSYVPYMFPQLIGHKNYAGSEWSWNFVVDTEKKGVDEGTFGFVSVYVDQRDSPDLITPLCVDEAVELINGTHAYVGITASTSERYQRTSISRFMCCERDKNDETMSSDWRGMYCPVRYN